MNLDEYSYVVVGSGILGTLVAERIANYLNEPVLVIEKKDHIGGNCYSETDNSTQNEYHKYGTHIFHTSDEKVWKYVNQFTSFNEYRHQVLASYKNKIYQLPTNLETINSFFNVNLKPYEVDAFIQHVKKRKTGNQKILKKKPFPCLERNCMRLLLKAIP